MALAAATQARAAVPVLNQLGEVCQDRGLLGMHDKLASLNEFMHLDMGPFEESLAELPRGTNLVQRSAHHLIARGGKRLRPLCVLLAARAGSGPSPAARELAVAVELVHSATLMHDDVVDLGEQRRGAAAARVIYGNAASIFAGDWLLIEAIRRVQRARVQGTLDRLLSTIEEMIFAESLQLGNRGRINADPEVYFQVVEGKTAALFRWAMFAGARAGGLPDPLCQAVEDYGLHLGVAFQTVDDLLDLAGDPHTTGKALFADLREGKMTLPLILALERDPALTALLEEILAGPPGEAPPEALWTQVVAILSRTGSLDDCLALARKRAAQAVRSLEPLPGSPARAALVTVAEATINREH